jgi:preprotein translocase subunit SecY
MYKDITRYLTLHMNLYQTNNFAFGFDYYQVYDEINRKIAGVVIFSFVFFNITFTRWTKWTSKNS